MFLITKRCSFTLKGEDASSSETGDSGYDISKIFIEDTRLHAIVLPDGRANWDIMKPDTTATAEAPVSEEEACYTL